MFIHNFKYSFKTLFRNKTLIFWTFAFPIILGTFFNMAFSNIENSEKLDIINIAIVNNENFDKNEILKEAFKELSDENNEDRLFNTKYVNIDEAKDLLTKGDITGYLNIVDENPTVTITTSGINETIFKFATEEIIQQSGIVKDIATEQIKNEMISGNINIDYKKIYKDAFEIAQNQEVKIENTSSNHLSYTMIEFYTLIAMACLYGGMLGMTAINQNLANMSSNGKRISVSPTNKAKVILSSLLASYITALIGLAILFIYTIVALKVDYGNNSPLIILLSCIGSLAGLTMGMAIATCLKASENTKTGIVISITMLGCFLSGMMGITMKYIVDKNMPIINKINPANMITDGFYSLYYYETLERYFFNIISLLIFSIIMIFLSYIILRRQRYESL